MTGSPELETSVAPFEIRNVKVIMPIGGLATRAANVTKDRIPKHLIELDDGRPVLDVICTQLQKAGFREFVFCVGHHKDQIIDHISREKWLLDTDTTYDFSEEKTPLGVDGAAINAIQGLGLEGQGMIIPGDLFLSWNGLAKLNAYHAAARADVTMGVTSHVTPRTTDVGKIIAEAGTQKLLWCHGREEEVRATPIGTAALTSVGTNVVSLERYVALRDAYLNGNPDAKTLSLRDRVANWAVQTGGFDLRAYDIGGEILDLGTPQNIRYGQSHWADYVP